MDIYPDQQDVNRVQTLTDYVDTTSAVFLGVTVGCARCHNHKFDPIPQRDYYRMQAIFEPAVKTGIPLGRLPGLGYRVSENTREVRLQELGDEIRAIQAACRTKLRTGDKQPSDSEIRRKSSRWLNHRAAVWGLLWGGYATKDCSPSLREKTEEASEPLVPSHIERLWGPVSSGEQTCRNSPEMTFNQRVTGSSPARVTNKVFRWLYAGSTQLMGASLPPTDSKNTIP